MDFIIQKVNGKDVSGLSHEDALRAFQDAVEPIIVEVKRRSNESPKDQKRAAAKEEPKQASQCTQTDVSLVGCDWVDDWRPEADCDSPEGDYIFPGDLPQSLSQYLEPEIDIEEIIIELPSSEKSLGLTLYYTRSPAAKDKLEKDATSPVEVDPIEVLVSQIEPGSAAARDGRIRIGDQILQINGEEITSKEQTEKIFKIGGQKTTLVVSRTQCYDEDDLEEGEIVDEFVQGEDNAVLSANSEFTSNSFRPVVGPMSKISLLENTIEESEENISASQSLTSDEVTINDNSLEKPKMSNPTMSSVRSNSPCTGSPPKPDTKPVLDQESPPLAVTASKLVNKMIPAANSFSHSLEDDLRRQPARVPNSRPPLPPPSYCSDSEHIYESIPSNSETDDEPIYHLPYEQKTVAVSASRVVRADGRSTGSSSSSGGSGHNKSSHRKSWTKDQFQGGAVEERDSSSAYNTGDSNDSKKATLEMCFGLDPELCQSTLSLLPPRRTSQTQPNSLKKDRCENCRKMDTNRSGSGVNHQECFESRKQSIKSCQNNYVSYLPAETVYTNQANLGETIWLQQQLFRHALVKRGQTKNSYDTERQLARSQSKLKTESPEKQWRVKIRPDGTRYITHRPARKKIMRDRELKIIEERSGLTTDDDTKSELKRGRYWPKEERRKHIEKERERKRQLELRKQTRQALASPLTDHPSPSEADKRWTQATVSQCFPRAPAIPQGPPPCNVYLTRTIPHHLMSPHLPYVPVQTRLPPPPKGLLSVTTV